MSAIVEHIARNIFVRELAVSPPMFAKHIVAAPLSTLVFPHLIDVRVSNGVGSEIAPELIKRVGMRISLRHVADEAGIIIAVPFLDHQFPDLQGRLAVIEKDDSSP